MCTVYFILRYFYSLKKTFQISIKNNLLFPFPFFTNQKVFFLVIFCLSKKQISLSIHTIIIYVFISFINNKTCRDNIETCAACWRHPSLPRWPFSITRTSISSSRISSCSPPLLPPSNMCFCVRLCRLHQTRRRTQNSNQILHRHLLACSCCVLRDKRSLPQIELPNASHLQVIQATSCDVLASSCDETQDR